MVFVMGFIVVMKLDDYNYINYYNCVMEYFFMDVFGFFYIEMVQVFVFIGGYYFYYINWFNMVNVVFGVVICMVFVLGFYCEFIMVGFLGSDIIVVEICCRIWWFFFCFDIWVIIIMGCFLFGCWGFVINICFFEFGINVNWDLFQYVGIFFLIENIKFCKIVI